MKTRERMRDVRRLPRIPLILAPSRLLAELTLLEFLRPAGTLVIETALPARRLIPTVRALRTVTVITPTLPVATVITVATILTVTPTLVETRRPLEIPFREIARTAGALVIRTALPARRLIPTTVRTLRAVALAAALISARRGTPLLAPVLLLKPLRPALVTRPVRIPRRLVREARRLVVIIRTPRRTVRVRTPRIITARPV